MPGGKGRINEYNESLTPEKRKENAKNAAKSPKRHRTKQIREYARAICRNPAPDAARAALAKYGICDEDSTTSALIALGIVEAALSGDMKAVEKVEKYLHEADNEREQLELRLLEARVRALETKTEAADPVQIIFCPRRTGENDERISCEECDGQF